MFSSRSRHVNADHPLGAASIPPKELLPHEVPTNRIRFRSGDCGESIIPVPTSAPYAGPNAWHLGRRFGVAQAHLRLRTFVPSVPLREITRLKVFTCSARLAPPSSELTHASGLVLVAHLADCAIPSALANKASSPPASVGRSDHASRYFRTSKASTPRANRSDLMNGRPLHATTCRQTVGLR
jgi:hypothetical protein